MDENKDSVRFLHFVQNHAANKQYNWSSNLEMHDTPLAPKFRLYLGCIFYSTTQDPVYIWRKL